MYHFEEKKLESLGLKYFIHYTKLRLIPNPSNNECLKFSSHCDKFVQGQTGEPVPASSCDYLVRSKTFFT